MAEKPSPSPQRITSYSPTGMLVKREALPRLENTLFCIVDKWESFAEQIGVPTEKVSEIRVANAQTGPNWLSTCLKQALEWWLNNHHNPTYEVIIAVLDPDTTTATMNRALAKSVREFMAQEQGETRPFSTVVGTTSESTELTQTIGHGQSRKRPYYPDMITYQPPERNTHPRIKFTSPATTPTATVITPTTSGHTQKRRRPYDPEMIINQPPERNVYPRIEFTSPATTPTATIITPTGTTNAMSRERSRETELTMPCLGRPFQLGMLYDCRSDQLIQSVTLWNHEKFKQACESTPQEFSKFEVMSENSIDIKLSKLGVDVDLKLSFLSGLVDISGAATYLNDQISSKNQARVSLKYQCTTRHDQLAMEKLGKLDNPDVLKDTSATHIISGVVYGADAIFVFDQEVDQTENFANIQEFMRAMVEKLCTSGNAALDINETDKKEVQKFHCQLHCDLSLPEYSTNFEGAVKLYKEFPKLLGGKVCPKTAWLYPLSKLDSEVVPITLKISSSLVNGTQKVMESLHEVEIKSNDLMNSKVCTNFPHIKEQILCFKRNIGEYKVNFSNNLAKLLPQIRSGDKEEAEMTELFKMNQASPFSHQCLSSWVEGKLHEVKILDRYLNSMKEIEFAFSPGDVDAFVNDLEYDHIISFTFKIAGRRDPYFEQMVVFLQTHKISQEATNPSPWYHNPTITKDLKLQARQFKIFAEANKQRKETKFVLTSSSSGDEHEQSDKVAVIELYDDCEKESFEPPSQPGKPKATNVTHDSIQLKWSEPKYGAHNTQFYTVHYCELSSSTEEWKVKKTKSKEESITINDLVAQKEYSFKVHADCKAGISLVSETSDSIQTYILPVNPGKLTASSVTHNSILLQWSKPRYRIHNPKLYTIFYNESKALESQWEEVKVEGTKEFAQITGLAAQTLYSFKVRAEFKTGMSLVSDVSDPIETYPVPVPPTKPSASCVTHNSIQLQWSKAQYRKQIVKLYTVLYYEMKDPPDSEPQWKEYKTASNEELTIVGDLAAQTWYCFKVCAEFQEDVKLVSEISDPIQTDPPPITPGKPTASNVTHNSLDLKWSKAQCKAQSVDFYTVLYRKINDPQGLEQWVKSTEQFMKVTGLDGQSLYFFKVHATFRDGTHLYSDDSDPIQTHPYPVVPGKPTARNVTHNSIQLQWSKPQFGARYVKFYTVFYQECNGPDHWIQRKTKPDQDEFLTVTRLGAKKAYVFTVHPEIVSEPGFIGKMSDQSDPIETEDRIALQMLTRKPSKEGPLFIHQMPFEKGMKPDNKRMIRKYFVGTKTVPLLFPEKVLMVVGATGSGKSTLINGMVNYIMGVDWEDAFRFKLIGDEGPCSQSKSQTKWITAYTLPKMAGSTIPYTLTIIDTPGFGDTEGLERDKVITAQVKDFFSIKRPNGIDHIDVIGFVTQSALPRLTLSQRYIFNSILAIFGKDVANNIFVMVTFADGQKPPVMTAIKDANFPCANFYKFNNSALFADNKVDESDEEEPENFDQMFWKMGVSSFKKFFNDFPKAESKSLQLTREVLDERERLEITINGLQPQIRNGLAKIEEMRQEEDALLRHEAEIATNKEFTFEVDVPKQRQISLSGKGIHVTNCLQCNFTCHETCGIAKDEDKHRCWAMTDGYCRICTNKCHWSRHVNNPYKYEQFMEKETRTSDELKRKFDQAVTGRTLQENMMASIDAQLKAVHTEVLTNIKIVQQCLRKLDEIALNPNPLKEVEYLEMLITSEQQAAQPGWKSRVQYLENAKEQAVMLQHIQVEDVVKQLDTERDSQEDTKSKSKSWYARFKGWVGWRAH